MTLLTKPPKVKFDANNHIHRSMFVDMQKSKGWGQIPIRFYVSDTGPDLITLIQRDMLAYYTAKEFG